MKFGCLLNLLVYAGLAYGYHAYLAHTLDAPAVWYASFGVALLTWGGLAVLYNAWQTSRYASLIRDAQAGLAPRDGRWGAVAGTMHPLDQPLTTPFTDAECVLYEFNIGREIKSHSAGGGKPESRTLSDFSGIAMTRCVVRSDVGAAQLFGFPDLQYLPERACGGKAQRERARRYVYATAWEDCTGLKIFGGAAGMWKAIRSADDAFRYDWRSIKPEDCDWLTLPPDESPVPPDEDVGQEEFIEEDEEDLEDEEISLDDAPDSEEPVRTAAYFPDLVEKSIAVGEQVVVLGPYDGVKQGFVSSAARDGQMIRIYRGRAEQVLAEVGGATWTMLIAGIVVLCAIQGILFGVLAIYRQSDATQRDWRERMVHAVEAGDVTAIDKMLARGLDVNAAYDDDEQTLLMLTPNAAVAEHLLSHGAAVDAADKYGRTALIHAVRRDRPEVLRVLIAAGADLNRRSTDSQTTALVDAVNSPDPLLAELLRSAGAEDDTITKVNGEAIDAEHPAFAACREYIQAIFAQDPTKLQTLSTTGRPLSLDHVDWSVWQDVRPRDPQLVEGFFRDDQATVTVAGVADSGFIATWVFQLRRENGEWRVARERWVTQ